VLAIVWPGYFSSPQAAPPMPPLSLSVECYAGTLASIQAHFDQHTLERSLPALTVPALFVLGGASPIPARHGVASAGLIPGAQYQIEQDCGHLPWLERPGSVRKALERIYG
jgi:pimeloyl-ACP methyl ester carboxylesterase